MSYELDKAKKFYLTLERDESSVLFGEDNLMNNLVKKFLKIKKLKGQFIF